MRSPRSFGVGGVPALSIQRRTLLKGMLGAGALAGLAGCGGGDGDGGGGGGGAVTFGSNWSDEVPKNAIAAMMKGFSGGEVSINTVDHNSFQENINNYLQGGPDDVFGWFAGYRMRFFAEQGLVGDISDVWSDIGSGFSEAMKQQSTGSDGKQYFVPLYYYPWAVFYRKSLWQERGYEPPATMDDLVALSKRMQGDGLAPIAFGDSDGWPAMGTFDYLNLRINGYDFHVELMAGEKPWNSPEVKAVFDAWRELLPYHQPDSLGRTWQEAAQSLLRKESGMYTIGMFMGQQFPEGAERDDLDFFPFPEIDPAIGTDAIEAPIDGFMMSARPRNEDDARELLRYLGTAAAGDAYLEVDPNNIGAHDDADTGGYNALQKKSQELVGAAKSISQFLDRDTRPDFASTVMIPSIQEFIRNPNDVDGLTKSIEDQKASIFGG
ncbi:sugar ABC transporter substrate-binding protein [Actinophytocola xinjiangensis]|uniref:Sugar ABC transporter substrate-binding protein n=1 Tax=Actinophytocola xinjiangensis TaxID=485602 RepID=A0A7Z0WFQ0_9PSEU|nr:ABC transporter substrate-binding protein [Actinophytocola xinjiangensis]OLF06150.1 sugar ABC transporter substrate-binding protein [Actinophytocola xinjiangensis]